MKKFILALGAMSMMLASCSKDMGGNEVPTPWNPTGEGYVSFNVGLPSANGSKANDDFIDGTADEYRVEDIILVLFTGDKDGTEENAVLASAYNLSDQRTAFQTVGTATDQITSSTVSSPLVAQIQKSTLTGDKVYAFVILNDHQFVTVDQANANLLASNKLFVQDDVDPKAGHALTPGQSLKGWKFSELKKLALDESGRNFANSSFLMSNSPVATVKASQNWNGQLSTLVEFNKEMIKKDRQEALENPAAVINVERALAKVTCEFTSTGKLDNNDQISFKILGWDLDNYNAMGYITRNFNDVAKAGYNGEVSFFDAMSYISEYYTSGNYGYRFSSPLPIAIEGNKPFNTTVYRTYWGQDVNYHNVNTPAALTDGAPLNSREGQSLVIPELRASGTSYYCPENTFDVLHQTVRNTTRLVLAVEINGGDPFFTLQENAMYLYPEDPNAEGSIHKHLNAEVANRVNVRNWAKDYIAVELDQEGTWAEGLFSISFVDELTEADTEGKAYPKVNGKKYAKVVVNPQADLSKFQGATDEDRAIHRSTAIDTFIVQGLNLITQAYLANEYNLHYYTGGIAYYQALIKHFGDYETPWKMNEDMDNTIATIYGTTTAEKNFLGRYGMVRNNWYQLKVTGIRNIGSPVVPPLTDDPDDTVENYMSVHINILPWAIRVQDNIVL